MLSPSSTTILQNTLNMSHGKHFTLYTTGFGPNGWYGFHGIFSTEKTDNIYIRKVAAVLTELGLTFEEVFLDLGKGEHKKPEHTAFNPNGRIPTLIDHKNNDFVIW
jgi:glutathione S-transferase